MDDSLSPAEQRKEKRRLETISEIQGAYLNLLGSKEVEEISMDEVAQAAGFSKGTLYNYFENKEDLIWTIIEKKMKIFVTEMGVILSRELNTWEKVHELVHLASRLQCADGQLTHLIEYVRKMIIRKGWAEQYENKIVGAAGVIINGLANFLKAEMDKGEIPAKDPERTACLIMFFISELNLKVPHGLIKEGDNEMFITELITGRRQP